MTNTKYSTLQYSIARGNLLLRCGLQARSARRREALRRPQREEGVVHMWRPPPYSLLITL